MGAARVVPFFETHGIPLSRVLPDRGTESWGAPERHEYERYLAIEDIDHTRTKVTSPQTNGIGASGGAAGSKLTKTNPSHVSARSSGNAHVWRSKPFDRSISRRADALAAQRIDPPVRGPLEGARVTGALRDPHAAVPADRREDAHRTSVVARHQERLAEEIEREVVARAHHLLDAADAGPLSHKDVLELPREELRRAVARGR